MTGNGEQYRPVTRLRVIDLETTGMEPPSEIIEYGFVDVEVGASSVTVTEPTSWLYSAERGIPPETMAVHHITPDEIPHGTPPCTPGHLHAAVWYPPTPDVFVAHNCEFERKFVTDGITGETPWICTYKAALHLWPDAPRHSNQVLRYWRGLRLNPALAMPPHRAGPDAWVTAQLLAEMVTLATIDQLVAWTKQPKPMPVIAFGKHRGSPWSDVPSDYLEWITLQVDMDADAVWYARNELNRRRLA
jgi:exodeoxyribonuclease X